MIKLSDRLINYQGTDDSIGSFFATKGVFLRVIFRSGSARLTQRRLPYTPVELLEGHQKVLTLPQKKGVVAKSAWGKKRAENRNSFPQSNIISSIWYIFYTKK